jgi:hypothetical protein
MATNLKSVNIGQNKYCGPAVLSILTGRSTDDCAYTISRINGQYSVAGVMLGDLLKAADKLGFASEAADTGNTLYGTFIRLSNNDGMYIISIPNHFVVIEVINKKIYFCDNHTKEPIPAESSARMAQKVQAAFRVWKKPEPPPKPTPVLLKRYMRVTENTPCVDIERVFEYVNPSDNRVEYVGEIKANDASELAEILDRLKELANH